MAADKPPSAMSAAALPQLKKVESFWVLMAAVRGERWSRAADPGCLLEQKQSQRPVSDGYCLLRKAKQYDSLLGVVLAKAEQSCDPPRHRLCLLSLAPTCSEGYPDPPGSAGTSSIKRRSVLTHTGTASPIDCLQHDEIKGNVKACH